MQHNRLLIAGLLVISLMLYGTPGHSQEEPQEPVGNDEVILRTVNTDGATMRFVVVAQGARWDSAAYLTSDYGSSERYIYGDCYGCPSPEGWDLPKTTDYGDPILAYGLYKIYHYSFSNVYFYIDLQDDRIVPSGGYNHDVFYTWDHAEETWAWRRPDHFPDNAITTGQTLELWVQCEQGSPTTGKFQPTDPANLTLTNSGGHPKLTWERSEPRRSAKYLVYRGSSSLTPSAITDTTFTDEDIMIGTGQTFYYKVRAVSGDGSKYSANHSNTVSTQGNFWKVASDAANASDSWALLPAWPNPFNPTTRIEYRTPNTEVVSLKVYDVLGREVAVLVNETKLAGTHEVRFNASGLPSVVYIYRLTSGNFIQSRKMLLLQ